MDYSNFYRDFEANFRGRREEILGRLNFYLPFLRQFILNGQKAPRLIDLGCGRGEFLELAGLIGFEAQGVDLDDGMLEDCFRRGLVARNQDAIACLRELADNSQAVVSGFHIAEHLPFDVLQTLIAEALRVLQPGGLLILETPNAENPLVGTLSFHMDPTHNKPLPPGLLAFLPKHAGFCRSKVFRLQENRVLMEAPEVNILDLLTGVSPDYCVIAQKPADDIVLASFERLFGQDSGLTLELLAQRFENKLSLKSELQNWKREEAMIFATRTELSAQVLELAEQNRKQYEEQLAEHFARIEAIYASTSWQITKPLRFVMRSIKRILRKENLPHTQPYGSIPSTSLSSKSMQGPDVPLPPSELRIFNKLVTETGCHQS